MTLAQHVQSLSSKATIDQLKNLLEKPCTPFRSWWRERLVTVGGYEGTVKIDEIAQVLLLSIHSVEDASTFRSRVEWLGQDRVMGEASLKDRLDYYELWGKVEEMYKATEQFEIEKSYPYKVVHGLDSYIGKSSLFLFSPQAFACYWPSQNPSAIQRIKCTRLASGPPYLIMPRRECFEGQAYLMATKEMVEKALRERTLM
jgi:hypothetical protein